MPPLHWFPRELKHAKCRLRSKIPRGLLGNHQWFVGELNPETDLTHRHHFHQWYWNGHEYWQYHWNRRRISYPVCDYLLPSHSWKRTRIQGLIHMYVQLSTKRTVYKMSITWRINFHDKGRIQICIRYAGNRVFQLQFIFERNELIYFASKTNLDFALIMHCIEWSTGN